MVFKRQKRRERGEKKMSSFGDGAVRAYQQHSLLCFLSAVKEAANKSPIKDTLRQTCILQM